MEVELRAQKIFAEKKISKLQHRTDEQQKTIEEFKQR
jgi:hypothetical protein